MHKLILLVLLLGGSGICSCDVFIEDKEPDTVIVEDQTPDVIIEDQQPDNPPDVDIHIEENKDSGTDGN